MKLETLNLLELNETEKIDTSGGFFGWFMLGLFIGWIFSGGEVTVQIENLQKVLLSLL